MKTYGMSTAKRLDVKESKDLVALKELEGRDLSCGLRRRLASYVTHLGSSRRVSSRRDWAGELGEV